ncbi:hypothetical protein [Anaerobacillus sp. 1_MG-2023]|uniref:hypothetical protein n=1 Tax=Anaerobacillus sp. 1_MG-2023 TaxID=3062655 RepID=UPI0026E45F86|nr:hypothetical protein [Anaerobacillus sp. 1_MG-2023]MDO6655707.1 hypothetical protein [Anaerobacillus sp. 1_MG-2023]
MYLLLSIFLASILGFILMMTGPLVGGIVAFGIVAGCLFRGLYLLHDIHHRVSKITPERDKVKEAYQKYLNERESSSS